MGREDSGPFFRLVSYRYRPGSKWLVFLDTCPVFSWTGLRAACPIPLRADRSRHRSPGSLCFPSAQTEAVRGGGVMPTCDLCGSFALTGNICNRCVLKESSE